MLVTQCSTLPQSLAPLLECKVKKARLNKHVFQFFYNYLTPITANNIHHHTVYILYQLVESVIVRQ